MKLAHSRWIKPAHMERAREYFARFGAMMTITVARFVPIVRTLAPFVAGLSQMPRGRFAYNVVGGVVWCSSMMLAGYWLGSIPGSGPTCIGSRSSSSACR